MDTRGNRTSSAAQMIVSGLSTGPGTGQSCDSCRQAIESSHVECRTVDARDTGATLRFHQWCYYARTAPGK